MASAPIGTLLTAISGTLSNGLVKPTFDDIRVVDRLFEMTLENVQDEAISSVSAGVMR